jgi:hypothetical protein
MKLMKAFTKKGYYCAGKQLVFKSYGNRVQGVLQQPSLEDEDGYIVHSIYCTSLDIKEQIAQVIYSYERQAGWVAKWMFRVFDENGEPYGDI